MASSALKDVVSTDETEMEEGKQTRTNGMEIATLEQFGNLVERCAITEPSDPNFPTIVIDISTLLGAIADNFSEMKGEELNKYSKMMAKMSSQYKDDPELLQQITDWCESRKRLIKITDLVADELDKNIQAVYMNQLCGLIIEILNSLSLNIYQELGSSIVSYVASSISPTFGLIIENTLPLIPYLKYTGAVCSLFENLRSEILIRRVLKAIQEDREKFIPLQKWFKETDQFEESVKQLFPYEIDKNIIENIEKYSKDLKEEQKIFATAILFITKKDPNLTKNKKVLTRIFLFCKSEAAKEWYRRMVIGARPLNLESSMIYIRNQLEQLEEIDAEPGLAMQVGKFAFSVESVLPRLILCSMNGIAVYSCYKKITSGTKHRYSIGMRQLVKNAESFLHSMEEIRIRRSFLEC